jgi:hypothetical protein
MTATHALVTPARSTALVRTTVLLILWFFAAVFLGLRGTLVTSGGPPIGLALAIASPLLLFWLDGRRGHPLFGGLARLDASALAVVQTFRVGGAVFLIAWTQGSLPAGFALPAGIGDIAVGLAAPFVAGALVAGKPYAPRLFRAWNILGLVDLVVAVSSGIAHSRTPLGFLATATGPTTDLVARYPLSLIPTFLVPIAVMLHAVGLRRGATSGRGGVQA